jgi:hypothetical protein
MFSSAPFLALKKLRQIKSIPTKPKINIGFFPSPKLDAYLLGHKIRAPLNSVWDL